MPNDTSLKARIARLFFVLYTVIMFWLLFGRAQGDYADGYLQQLSQRIVITPFETIRKFLRVLTIGSFAQKRHAVINLVGNVIMFVPFGYLLPSLFPKFRPFIPFFLRCLSLIVLVEITQLFMLVGFMDIDDVILNMVGFTLGYCVYKVFPLHNR